MARAKSSAKRKSARLVVDERTSQRLGRIRQRDTSAELAVRRLVHRLGHRFRVRNRDLPGSPDVANRRAKWAIFVHGCFWHRHRGCVRATTPSRNREFWLEKFETNVVRDQLAVRTLRRAGWKVVIVWECEIEKRARYISKKLELLA